MADTWRLTSCCISCIFCYSLCLRYEAGVSWHLAGVLGTTGGMPGVAGVIADAKPGMSMLLMSGCFIDSGDRKLVAGGLVGSA